MLSAQNLEELNDQYRCRTTNNLFRPKIRAKNSVSNYLPNDLGDTLVAHHIAFICGAVSGHMHSSSYHPSSIGFASIRSSWPLRDESRNFLSG